MRRVEGYIQKYGPLAGPKLYRMMRSRAAQKGVSTKLRKKIASLKDEAKPAIAEGPKETQAMLPLSAGEESVGSGPVLTTA